MEVLQVLCRSREIIRTIEAASEDYRWEVSENLVEDYSFTLAENDPPCQTEVHKVFRMVGLMGEYFFSLKASPKGVLDKMAEQQLFVTNPDSLRMFA